jgi:hypothetical protein
MNVKPVIETVVLNAKIYSITSSGLVTVNFNDDIFLLKNISIINQANKIIVLSIIPSSESEPADLNFTWMINSMNERQMKI